MASVVEVQTNKPRVTGVTLKLDSGEASDMLVYIKNYVERNHPYAGPLEQNTLYKAIKAALDGKAEKVTVGSAQF